MISAPVPRHTSADLQWLAPAPLWTGDVGPAASGLTQPWIAELQTDRFMDEFDAMTAGEGDRSPAELLATRPETTVGQGGSAAYRLYQPLSRRYYLVCASLVCRRPGIPDHPLVRADGERAMFVMRQVSTDGSERALVGGDWVAVSGTELANGEKTYPMHSAPVAAFAEPDSTAGRLGMSLGSVSTRDVFVGYVPVTERDALVRPLADPVAALAAAQVGMPEPKENPNVDELIGRVIEPWKALLAATTDPAPPNIAYASLFLLLDLLDWLGNHLDAVADRIVDGTPALPTGSDALALFDALHAIVVPTSGGDVRLDEAMKAVANKLDLVHGSDTAPPSTTYDLRTASISATWLSGQVTSGSLAALAAAALDEAGAPIKVPPELQGLIKADPVVLSGPGSAGKNQAYVIRIVLLHEPCRPLLSAPTHRFELARALDADAPARPIVLQVPDIDHLRSFNRGVAIEMPPSLRTMLLRVTPDLLKDKGLLPDPGLQLGMICSFSLQIIFLVAFIVMFIFLILLNIVFWWLPFLKICFPIPVPPSKPNGPTP